MKAFKFLRAVIILGGILLSACTAAPASQTTSNTGNAGSDKPLSEVELTGVIDSMNGDQWVVSGQPITVDSSTLQEGDFLVGDTVKVEAIVAADGSVTAQSVESPSAADLGETATSTSEPSATEPSVVIDNDGNEAVGTVEAITDTSITISGQTYSFAPGAEIKGIIEVGAIVKLHFLTSADGTLLVREVETPAAAGVGNDNGNDDNTNDTNVNDNSSNDNSDDDNSNANSNDDENDDNGNDDDSDDDNSNDDGNGNG